MRFAHLVGVWFGAAGRKEAHDPDALKKKIAAARKKRGLPPPRKATPEEVAKATADFLAGR